MNISQTTLTLAIIVALSFVTVVCIKLNDLYSEKISNIKIQKNIDASGILNKAIIELSLERSVMQVTLNLDSPIQQQFKDLLEGQRTKSDAGFDEVTALIESDTDFRRGEDFLNEFKELRRNIKEIRAQADKNLALNSFQRNQNEVKNLPSMMKDTIISFSLLPIKLRAEDTELSTVLSVLKEVQRAAWAIREFGGRERTYMAIATATGRPFSAETELTMRKYHASAMAAMEELELLSEYVGLSEEVVQGIQEIKSVYFGSYERTRNNIKAAETANQPYPISFGDFFTESSEALDTAVQLSYLAGDEMSAYMEQKKNAAGKGFWFFVALLIVIIAICAYQIYYTQFKVSKRIITLVGFMEELSDGNTNFSLDALKSSDEIGKMSDALEVFRENALRVTKMEAEQKELEAQQEVERKTAMLELADSFYEKTADLISSLTMSSNGMQETAQVMSATSEQTKVSSLAVANAATEASDNVQTVAAAAEELAASSQEISKQIADVANRSSTAAREAEVTSQSVKELEELADSIGDVVNAIKDIAEQTNLLALNATIEAARAGAAGKGFAVVADEVKKLANETGQKTEEIDERVNHIQEAIRNSVNAMSRIIDNVQQIDHATASVASAVEEQNASTSEIGRNVSEASSGTEQVTQNIGEVQTAAGETGKAASDVLEAANELAEVSKGLNNTINTFLDGIRKDNKVNDNKVAAKDLPEAAE